MPGIDPRSEDEAIRQCVDDYYGGWYDGDASRMDRCLHPTLAKRGLRVGEAGERGLSQSTKESMVNATREGIGSEVRSADKHWSSTILDEYGGIANVRVVCPEYVEYLHLVQTDDRWQIVNALWVANREDREGPDE